MLLVEIDHFCFREGNRAHLSPLEDQSIASESYCNFCLENSWIPKSEVNSCDHVY